MSDINEHERAYSELYGAMQQLLPERCRGCGHTSKGLRLLAQELVDAVVSAEDAHAEMVEAARDIDTYCTLGYVASELYPDKKVCSFEIKPHLIDTDPDERNRYFDIRFEN